jgi:hypothetical protein
MPLTAHGAHYTYWTLSDVTPFGVRSLRVRCCVGCVPAPRPPAFKAYRPPPAAVCRAYQPPDPRRLVPLGRRLNRTGPGNPATFIGDACSVLVRASSSCGSSTRLVRFPARLVGVLHHRPGPAGVRHHPAVSLASSPRRKPCHVHRRRVLGVGACFEQLRFIDASGAVSCPAHWQGSKSGPNSMHARSSFSMH